MALAAPVRLERPRPRASVRLRLAALVAALAGHGAILYGVTRQLLDLSAGGQGQVLAAVNVTMVDSTVLESRDARPAPAASAKVDAVEIRDGSLESTSRPKTAEQKEQAAEAKEVPRQPAPDDALATEPPKAEERPQEENKERKEASPAAKPVGGASVRGDAPTATMQSAPAAARAGAVRAYANAVTAALARCKPKGVRGYGAVRVKLVVAPEGGIASLEVLGSRGNRELRDKALAAVRQCDKLPTPPPGFALNERWFEWTYTFSQD